MSVVTHGGGPKWIGESMKTCYKPCPMRSSITDQPCLLPDGHPPDSHFRFHKFGPPVPTPDPDLAYAENGDVVGRVIGWINGVPVIEP